MLRIIDARNRKALDAALTVRRADDRAFDRRVAAIVERVRRDGDRALIGFARRFDRVAPPFEVSRDQMREAAALVPADVRRAIRQAARYIARMASAQLPKRLDVRVAPGVSV